MVQGYFLFPLVGFDISPIDLLYLIYPSFKFPNKENKSPLKKKSSHSSSKYTLKDHHWENYLRLPHTILPL